MSDAVPTEPTASGLSNAALRRAVYLVLITVATGAMLGRILTVDSVNMYGVEKQLKDKGRTDWHKSRPFLSANDRSRWATVRALVEHGTYAIDDVIAEPGWDTIDMVKHAGADGQQHLYSSKPPLMATLMAGPYWLIYQLGGTPDDPHPYSLGKHPYLIGRLLVVLYNLPAMLIYFFILAALAERLGTTDWGRIFMMAAATFGTFLTTFAVSINNHLGGALCAAIALLALVRIVYDGRRELRWFFLCGLFAALTASFELPALAFLALTGLGLLIRFPRPTLLAFAPPALLVIAAYLATNYLAHGDLREPYSHWEDWYFYTYELNGKVRDSYWKDPKGIDKGEPSVATYALHTLVGHHGIFSLTPIWVLSVIGLGCWLKKPDRRALALGIAVLSLVVYVFYLLRPEIQRNYGGTTSGLRWMFWFAPLWLAALLPAADWCAQTKLRRGLALVLLGLSVVSASAPTWNPWTHPWILNFLVDGGWVTLP